MADTKPILISGAGLSGLLLAHSLKSHNIPFIIYERDASIAARAQGYRLRISTDGLNALKEVLTEAEFDRLHEGTAATGGGGIHSLDAITGERASQMGPAPGGKGNDGPGLGGDVLGISRGYLRECLAKGAEEYVRWDRRATGYSVKDSGVTIQFADGTESEEGTMLVAADGPQSAITAQLTGGKVRAYDTGARMIHGQTPAKAYKGLGEGVSRRFSRSSSFLLARKSMVERRRSQSDDQRIGLVRHGRLLTKRQHTWSDHKRAARCARRTRRCRARLGLRRQSGNVSTARRQALWRRSGSS